jgi:malate/lactate dehydrogenase
MGSAATFDILKGRISDIVLIDASDELAKGEGLDIMQASSAIKFDGKIRDWGPSLVTIIC